MLLKGLHYRRESKRALHNNALSRILVTLKYIQLLERICADAIESYVKS